MGSCDVWDDPDAEARTSNISSTWLQHSPSVRERVASITLGGCSEGAKQCTYVQTTTGRVVKLRQSVVDEEFVPAQALWSATETLEPSSGTIRTFNGRYMGVLQRKKQSIQILDSQRGGVPAGQLFLPPSIPVASWSAGGGYLYLLSA